MAVNRVANQIPGAAAPLDPESAEWLRALADTGPRREAALGRLHGMLLRIAQRECQRRGPRLRITGPELEDLAYQAAADALMAIIAKLGQFRGESRFGGARLRLSLDRCLPGRSLHGGRARLCQRQHELASG